MSAPTEEDRQFIRALAQSIDKILNGDRDPKTIGFVLLVFPEEGHEGARTNYVSNCARPDMIAAMKEVLARFEGQAAVSGRA